MPNLLPEHAPIVQISSEPDLIRAKKRVADIGNVGADTALGLERMALLDAIERYENERRQPQKPLQG